MDKGSDFKNFGGDSVFDVVLFADMLKDRYETITLVSPFPSVTTVFTMSPSLVLVIRFFPPRLSFLTTSID